ncbi:MAG: hypothetical protein ACI9LN_001653 [Saprospiraceae bacterium]|jgi:hypothetical protein
MQQTLNLIILTLTCCLLQFNLSGQNIVYPGDINNNGIVSGVDLLYFGTAFEATGGERPGATLNWLGQEIEQPWTEEFPGGINLSYADADGNGVVDENDLLGGILGNFEKLHGAQSSEGYMNGVEGIDPLVALIPHAPQAYPNSEIGFDIELGSSALPIAEFYGISFIVRFSEDVIDESSGVQFEIGNNSWIDPAQNNHRKIATLRDDGSIEFAITRLDKQPISGSGNAAQFFIIIEDFVDDLPADSVEIFVENVRLTNEKLETFPMALGRASFELIENGALNPPSSNCPNIVAPVCASNGVTYLNSCYALEAGITDFTPGLCYSDCIDPESIKPDEICSTVYDPVCSCNDVTYSNACEADKAGVTAYSSGACNTSNCYNPQQVAASGNTTINPDDGTISVVCPPDSDPVCGCDGITYSSACLAEASGITFYTSGSCGTCVDPWTMNPDALCTYDYEPVCGCNEVTYLNACQATAAGVTNFSAGACGLASTWCNEAIPIQCGDFLPIETTIGAGNDISVYQNCINSTMVGPDKVYVINKNTPGDLQIGLEITTPNMDLDLILLDANCSAVTCLAASHTSNSLTNNEGILYEDAPIGTYYIVVDGQYANSEGNYRLEVSCAYLDCSDAQPLTCGTPYLNNNINGNDNVSLYHCGNVLNVENNGPEMVHTFTITEPGQVDISLTNLTANLELFLLDACDNSECLNYSQNGSTGSEFITTFLAPGTYYIIVDGYNGATSDYSLQVDCEGTCNLDIAVNSSSANCLQNDGSITVMTNGGTASYIITWAGSSISGTVATYQPTHIINDLPAGNYTITVTDVLGCSETLTTNVSALGGLNIALTPSSGDCSVGGNIQVNVLNGIPSYQITLDGPTTQIGTTSNDFYNFNNLPAGNYTVTVVDSSGCYSIQTTTIEQGEGMSFQALPNAADCGQSGSIDIIVDGGTAPFAVFVTGTINGSGVAQTANFSIQNLPGGSYIITIQGANGCQATQQVDVPNFQLDISAVAYNGICGANGSVSVNVNSGSGPYTLTWSGLTSGTATNGSGSFIIPNLPSGTYTIQVTDNEGCTDFQTVTLDNSAPFVAVAVTTYDADCDNPGFIWLSMNDGVSPYNISWSGPVSGDANTFNSFYPIADALAGFYNVVVTDANGCTYSESVTVGGGSAIAFQALAGSNNCGQNGSIDINIFSGDAPYTISWNGPIQNSTVTNDINYTIENLPSGTYSIEVMDANQCAEWAIVTLNTTNSLTFTATPNNGDCGENGTISINISGGSGNYDVSWNGPTFGFFNTTGNSFIIPNLPSGTYTINITDSNDCSAMQSTTLINGSNSSVTATFIPTLGSCGENGSIAVTVTSGNGPYFVDYDGPSTGGQSSLFSPNFNFPNLQSGNYIFTVTAGNDCSIMQSVFLNPGNAMTFVATTDEGTCGQFGDIEINISGGNVPYNISWTGQTSSSVTVNSNTYTIPNLLGGNYTIIVNDNDGCSTQQSIVLDNGENVQFWATANAGGCGELGSILVGISTGVAPYTIGWSGAVSSMAITSDPNFNISNLPSDTYSITVFDANGCGDNTNVVLNNANSLNLSVTENNGSCGQNGSLTLNFSGGNAPYTVNYNGAASGSFTENGNATIISNLPNGNYNITVTSADGCMVAQTATLNNGNGIAIWTTPNSGTCSQLGNILVDVTGGAAPFNVTWSGAANGSSAETSNIFTIPNLGSGTYTVTVFDANGCSDSNTTTLTNASGISLWVTPANGSCGQNGSIALDFNGGNAPYTIIWNGQSSGTNTINGNVFTIPNLQTGNYNITVTNADGCSATQSTTILNNGSIAIWATPTNGNCGQQGSILVDVTGGTAPFTYAWSGQSNGLTTNSSPNYTIPNLSGGNYTITVTGSNNCLAMQNATIATSGNVSLWATGNNGNCGQLGNVALDFNGGTAPYTIIWNGTSSGTNMVNGNLFTIPNLQSGNYNITVTDATNCSAVQSAVISNSGSIGFAATSNNGACGQPGSISISIANGTSPYTLTWTGATTGNTTINNTNTYTILALPTGSYNLMLTDANGCSSNQSVTLNNGSAINFAANVMNGSCGQLGNIALNVTGGNGDYLVLWASSNGNGSAPFSGSFYTIQNLVSANYTVVVSDSNGCSATQSLNINNGTTLDLMATGINGACGQNGQINLIFSTGNPPFNLSWTGTTNGNLTINGMSAILPNLPTGNYNINVTDNNNCSGSASVAINNAPTLLANVTGTNTICNGANSGSATANTSGGTFPFTFAWSNGGITETINNLASGTYTVTVMDGAGCIANGSISIMQSTPITIDLATADITCNGANDGSLLATGWGGAPPYNYAWNTGLIYDEPTPNAGSSLTNLSAGTYTVTVTDQNGCQTINSIAINEPQAITLQTTFTNASCGGNNGSATVNPSGGNAPYSFQWSNTGTGQTIFGIAPGTYTVQVFDANFCVQTASVTVGNDSQNAVASYTVNENALTWTFTNTSVAGTTYFWGFGDGNTSTSPNTTNTFCEAGFYNICLTATNACGSDTYCEMMNVSIPANYAILDVGEVVGNNGETLDIPVTIQNVTSLASIAGSIEIENSAIGTIIGMSAGVIDPSFNPALNTFSFFSASGLGEDVNNGDILFYIQVQVNGNTGDVTKVNIGNTPLSVEVGIMVNGAPTLAPHAVLKGSASIFVGTVATVNGWIQTWWGEGINNVTVNVWNDNFDETYYTDIDGNYVTNPMTAGETFIFEPSKDTLPSNGISTFGLFIGQQYILGHEPALITSPYQIIAGDANCNGSFTTLDLFAIQQQLIGATPVFSNCPSWVFIPDGFQMASFDNPQSIFPFPSIDTMLITADTTSSFIGVKVGDLLGDANPELLLSADDRSGDFVLTTKNQTVKEGDIIEITLAANELREIATMQFALNFNDDQLQFLTIENGKIESPLINLLENELRFSWFDLSGQGLILNEKDNLFTLRFQALQDVADLSNSLNFKNDLYKSVAYEATGAAYDLHLAFDNTTPTTAAFNLYQNVPNPFGDFTNIQFELPAAATVKMTIQNSRGEVMRVVQDDFAKGLNDVLIGKNGLSGGVYYYTLETDGFVETRRMVIL